MTKKLLFVLAYILTSTFIYSQDFSINGINYTITDEANLIVEVSSGSCYDGDLELQSTIENSGTTYSVESIGQNAFGSFSTGSCNTLTAITIPSSVKIISSNTFYGCENLETISILGDGLEKIDSYALRGTKGLRNFNIEITDPSNVDVGYYSFSQSFIAGVKLNIPEGSEDLYASASYWQDFAVYDLFNIDGVNYRIADNINNEVEIVSGSCYDGNLVLADNVTYLNTSYTIKSIDAYAFSYDFDEGCQSVTAITIPDSVTSIGYLAFANCENLSSVSIGNGLEEIISYGFYNIGVTNFEIDVETPVEVTQFTFGPLDFSSITLNVPEDSQEAYANSPYWEYFSIYGGFTIDGINYNIIDPNNKLVEIVQNSCHQGDLVLNETVEYEGDIYTLTSIGYFAFSGDAPCNTVTSISIPDTVIDIKDRAFNGCENLLTISIGAGLTSIGEYSFTGLDSLNSFSINNPTPLSDISESFAGTELSTVDLTVPEGSESSYAAADIWKKFKIYDSFSFNGINYKIINLENKTVEIVSGSCYEGDLVLNQTITYNDDNYTLVGIADGAFSNGYNDGCDSLTSVVFPNSITYIGSSAFYDCNSLTSISIGDSIENIGSFSFYNDSLENVSIETITPPSSGSFIFNTSNLTISTSVPKGSEVNYYSTTYWDDLNYLITDFEINGIIYEIEVENATIKEGSCYTGDLVLKETIEYIGKTYNITSIGDNAFNGNDTCNDLTSVSIPNTITSVGESAFANLDNLTTVTIGNGLQTIGNLAFSSENITNFKINIETPISLTTDSNIFNGLDTSSVYLEVPENSKEAYSTAIIWEDFSHSLLYFTIDGINYSVTDTENNYVEVSFGSCYDGELTLTETIEYLDTTYTLIGIGEYAFGEYFSENIDACNTLTSIDIPNSVTYIGYSSFYACESLTDITIGNGIESITNYAFTNVPLENFSIDIETPLNISSLVFDRVDLSETVLNVPEGTESTYATTDVWKDFRNNISEFTIDGINYSVTDKENNYVEIVFESCYDGELTLTETIEYIDTTYTLIGIGEYAFGQYSSENIDACNTLTSINIPNSVTYIGYSSFYGCKSLTDVTIGNGIESITNYAFTNVPLENFSIDIETPLIISSLVFDGVDLSETILNIPEGTESTYASTEVWKDFFYNISEFTIDGINYSVTDTENNYVEVTFGSCYDGKLKLTETIEYINTTFTLVGIGEYAFGQYNSENIDACNTITSIDIPDSVTYIGYSSFYGCESLTDVTIGNAVESITNYAFTNVPLENFSIDIETPLIILSLVFDGVDLSKTTLNVPEGTESTYASTEVWKDFSYNISNFTLDGINYSVTDKENNYVEIAFGSCYDGELMLTETIEYLGTTYTLVGIGEYAFGEYYSENIDACNTLTSIDIPNSVTYIGYSSFYACESLTDVTIGNGIESIINYAFTNVPLENLSIDLDTPLSILSLVFDGVNLSKTTLNVPEGTESAYASTEVWKDFNINNQNDSNLQCNENINIPDENFKTVLLNNSNINTDGNEEISCEEAYNYTGLIQVNFKYIYDLTGIEYFENITVLDCGFNYLTSLDLTNNKALTTLYCHQNALTYLDLSQNSELIELYCTYNNFTSINLSNGNNTNLDTSYSNFHNNDELTCIQVDDVSYSEDNWSSLIDSIASFSEYCEATASLGEFELNKFNIYPNPVDTMLTIQSEYDIQHTEIYNLQGQKVFSVNYEKSIDVSSLVNGVYLLKLHTASGQSNIKRFIKK